MNLVCVNCGARCHVANAWQGGDRLCRHLDFEREPDKDLKSDIELLLKRYRPEQITETVLWLLTRKL